MKKERPKEVINQNVLIYPAMTIPVEGKRIYILFSLYQVEDIQGKLTFTHVPFSVPFVEGITIWRHSAIPVISLERYLGMEIASSNRGQRFIVIRSTRRSQEGTVEMRSAIKIEREIKMMPIPDVSELVKPNGWVNSGLVKGVFEWDEGLIVVPETDKLIQEDLGYSD